ncbi:MAG: hypothetical protein LAP85_13310 [Acidobacteriia bacterium]|nr:hypothetical protein [Terriglobia bacterium]
MPLSRLRLWILPVIFWMASAICLPAQEEPKLSEEQMREFLLNAKVLKAKNTPKGVTSPFQLTLSDGNITHDAAFQRINEYKMVMEFGDGHKEMNFHDSYKYDIAAYELAKLLGLGDMMPVTVERKWRGDSGAMSWWLPVTMDEATRLKKKIEPPDVDAWNKQMYKKRIFGELVYDTDPNLTNVLISADWHLWMIDFSRAFRIYKELRDSKNVTESKCERQLLERLRKLDRNEFAQRTKGLLTKDEIDGVMARRDKIVAIYEGLIAKKGEKEVLYDDPIAKKQ